MPRYVKLPTVDDTNFVWVAVDHIVRFHESADQTSYQLVGENSFNSVPMSIAEFQAAITSAS